MIRCLTVESHIVSRSSLRWPASKWASRCGPLPFTSVLVVGGDAVTHVDHAGDAQFVWRCGTSAAPPRVGLGDERYEPTILAVLKPLEYSNPWGIRSLATDGRRSSRVAMTASCASGA